MSSPNYLAIKFCSQIECLRLVHFKNHSSCATTPYTEGRQVKRRKVTSSSSPIFTSWENTSLLTRHTWTVCLWTKDKDFTTLPSLSLPHFSSVTQSCPTLCNPMNRSTPGLPVHHQLLEFTQTHVHWVGDAIQPSHPLSSPSPALNLAQHQGLFQWVSSSHQVAKGLGPQFQHQSFQWIFRVDFL